MLLLELKLFHSLPQFIVSFFSLSLNFFFIILFHTDSEGKEKGRSGERYIET